ncbi:hypothetical protein DRO55_01990 [Candidatus Bathyarchaeota archaeon]|nr:MAG: hypothetical protein DRO55_01990 [Candidatus Bathyarchaeota archaeon]
MRVERWIEAALDGEYGEGLRIASRMLVAIGEAFEADRLIPVRSCHISGVSYRTIGEPGLRFLEDLASSGVKARVKATMNPAGMDMSKWAEMGVPENFAQKQFKIVKALESMGIEPTLTCTPYLAGNSPDVGSHLAWAESSAVIYVNSVLGAMTNRESGPSALASALTGLTPRFGMHVNECRRPTHLVEVEGNIEGALMFSALGYLVGREVGRGVPSIPSVRGASGDELKALSAGLGTSGGVSMFTYKTQRGLPRIKVHTRELLNIIEKLSTGSGGVVCLGCPHLSLAEVRYVLELLKGRRVRGTLWLFTSRAVYRRASSKGLVQALERLGVRVFKDTCMVVAPLEDMGVKSIVTDSCKAAHYVKLITGGRVQVSLMSREECIKEAIEREA